MDQCTNLPVWHTHPYKSMLTKLFRLLTLGPGKVLLLHVTSLQNDWTLLLHFLPREWERITKRKATTELLSYKLSRHFKCMPGCWDILCQKHNFLQKQGTTGLSLLRSMCSLCWKSELIECLKHFNHRHHISLLLTKQFKVFNYISTIFFLCFQYFSVPAC